MNAKASSRYSGKIGFTLVELLVSIAILSIMLLSLAQAIGFVSQIWLNGIGAVDNFSKARVIMNILDRDIQQMVMRPDVSAFVDDKSQSACAFYTNVQGVGADTRAVSLVRYLPDQPSPGSIQRLNYGMNFTTGGVVPALVTPVIAGSATANPLSQLTNVTSAGTETLATGVIRFQWQFVDGEGNILTPDPTYNYSYTTASGSQATASTPFFYDYTAPTASTNPRAVVVSILVLSNSAYQLATQNASILTKLQTDFPNTLPTGNTTQTYSQYWNGILNPATGTLDGTLPPMVRGGLRVFERYIPLPVVTPTS